MFYSSGNYEAFARPRKPAGVDDKTAWFVGAGLSSLSGAAFLIRDGQISRDKYRVRQLADGVAGIRPGAVKGCLRDAIARVISQANPAAVRRCDAQEVPRPRAEDIRRRPGQPHFVSVAIPNLLQRQFTVTRPNTKWVTDITFIRTWQGWLYLAAVMDLFSRKVVGWSTPAVSVPT